MNPTNPLGTTKSILAAVQQDPKLANDENLKKSYLSMGGTLTDNMIPTSSIVPGQATVTAGAIPAKPPTSSTTFSNYDMVNTVVPANNRKLETLSSKGSYMGADGVPRYADNTIMQSPTLSTGGSSTLTSADTLRKDGGTYKGSDGKDYYNYDGTAVGGGVLSAEDQSAMDILTSMKANLDASTKAQIDAIHQQFEARRKQMEDINTRQGKGVNQSLLMGGSSRYAPVSSEGIMSTQERYGVQELANLDAQENTLIAAAKQAQESGNQQLLAKQLDLVEEKRKEKAAAAQKLSETIAAQNVKLNDANRIGSLSSTVADLMRQGITDPKEIIDYVNYYDDGSLTGANLTADELKKMVDTFNLEPNKDIGEVFTALRNNMAPPEIVDAVSKCQDLACAVKAAGIYGTSASGMAGEYYAYVRDAQSRGKTPVDFNTYQTMDANRKAKIASAGAAKLSGTGGSQFTPLEVSRLSSAANRIASNFVKLPAYQNVAGAQTYLERIQSANEIPGSISDEDLLDSLIKLNTGGNAVTEAQVKLITQGRSYLDSLNVWRNALNTGGVLSPKQRTDITELANSVFEKYKKAYDPVYKQVTKQLRDAGIPEAFWGIPNLNALSEAGSTADDIHTGEDAAEKSVTNWATQNPTSPLAETAAKLENAGQSYLVIKAYLARNGVTIQ